MTILARLLLIGSVVASPFLLANDSTNFNAMLPQGDDWLAHVEQGLSPYWMAKTAQGNPIGNFPTFRCDNGEVLDQAKPCAELASHGWIKREFGRDFTRMKARQTYAYGVRYHLTGDEKSLQLAKAGVDYLLSELRDTQHGGMISVRENGEPIFEWQQRTSQDQAYAIVGLAFYYYLTRDPIVEKALIEQQEFVFDHYKNKQNNQLLWVIENSEEHKNQQLELVAQLDQINAYLLLVMPLLPEEHKQRWEKDLRWLTEQMIALYHNDEEWRFYGAIHHPAMMQETAKHNDYGHTIKAYWMTYLVGKELKRDDWIQFAVTGMEKTIERAMYQYPKTNLQGQISASDYDSIPYDQINSWREQAHRFSISSWQWAELDQALMTLSLREGKNLSEDLVRQLFFTTTSYQQFWVDHQYGGVGLKPKSVKQFHWGNGYHQFEHALVGYISAQGWYNKPARLYYALPQGFDGQLQPYYFSGKAIETVTSDATFPIPTLKKVQVDFAVNANQ